MARDGMEGLEALDTDDDGLVDMDGDGVEDLAIEDVEQALADGELDEEELADLDADLAEEEPTPAPPDEATLDDLDDMDAGLEADTQVEGPQTEPGSLDDLDDMDDDSAVDLSQDPVTEQDKGELLRTVDTTGDGYADVMIYDRNDDGKGDFVEGDVNNDGFEDIRMVDTDGDGESELTRGSENYGLLSDSTQERIDTIDLDRPDLDSDRDGLTNIQEHDAGLNPVNADADNDSLSDGEEVAQGSDPEDYYSYRDAGEVAWETGLELEHDLEMAAAEIEGFGDDAAAELDVVGFAAADADAGDFDVGGYDVGADGDSDY